MALYSLVDKPVWLNSTQKAATVATAGGWVYTRPDGTAEKLVGISNMTTKMIPVATAVTTDETSYEIGTDTTIEFTVDYNRNIKTAGLTSATTLTFLVDETEYTALYDSMTDNTVTFVYTIPTNGDEYDITETSSIGLDSITLNTGEDLVLDYDDFDIDANLTLPSPITATITQKAPAISGVTTDKASYTLGTDTEIIFTVDFDRTIKSSGLTAATVLTFVIGNDSYDATFTSISGDDAVFTWTIPDPATDVDADTTIDLTAITLNTGEDILLDSTVNTVSAVLTGLPASINVTIVKP